jgi:hypothetical protein
MTAEDVVRTKMAGVVVLLLTKVSGRTVEVVRALPEGLPGDTSPSADRSRATYAIRPAREGEVRRGRYGRRPRLFHSQISRQAVTAGRHVLRGGKK